MNDLQTPWSHILWGIGLILLIGIFYQKQKGTYYTGEDLSTYTDTLQEKIWYSEGGKGVSSKYYIQLAYGKSDFIITGNGCSLIKKDDKKRNLINSLAPGSIVTVWYKTENYDLIDNSRNKVAIVGIAGSAEKILNPEELLAADKKDMRNYFIAGTTSIILGTLSYFVRVNKSK